MSDHMPERGDALPPEVDPDIRTVDSRLDEDEADSDPMALKTETLLPEDEDDLSSDPPDAPSTPTAQGYTMADEAREETIDERLAQEVPDVDPVQQAADEANREILET